jgi:tRNA modification GTPase
MGVLQRPESIAASLPGSEDTIVAVATAQGRGALAVIRLSGPRAFEIARSIVASWPGVPRRVTLSAIEAPHSGTLLDHALVTRYDRPHSYTGEDTVELTTHGGILVPSTIIAALIERGARQAMPGEFTRRAVLNAKLDVMQAEAVADLIDARSRRGQAVALAQLDGGLSRRITELRSALIEIEALLAYDIDFPEEDDGPVPAERITQATDNVLRDLAALRATASTGELVREGAVVVFAGAPNVGKSSLFNALLGQSRAIVTDIPGTTRDALEAVIDAGSWALRLVDTAGLRDTSDRVEQMGIEMSARYLDRSAVVLACSDSEALVHPVVSFIRHRTKEPIIVVRTKADITGPDWLSSELVAGCYQSNEPQESLPAIAVSAESGSGLDALIALIVEILAAHHAELPLDEPVLTRARHQHAVDEATREVERFRSGWTDNSLPAPVAATHLRNAVVALEELIGVVGVDDVLDRVFSAFCVGK